MSDLKWIDLDAKKLAAKLVIAIGENDKRVAELVIANDEKEKRLAELVIANDDKDKRAAELVIANDEKDKRAAELAIANKELSFQNDEKEARAVELAIANQMLGISRDEANKANLAKSEFLASMSHDLRTPLNAILGFSDMMLLKTFGQLGDVHYDEYAKDIHDSGSLLLSLINDVLDLSKVEAGKYDLVEEHLNIQSLLENSFMQLNHMAKTSNQTLTSDIPFDTPSLLGDERVMTQILNNLLSNAIKFTPDGGTISVTAKVDGNKSIILKVTDMGMGMSEEDVLKALKPFEQADAAHTRAHKGTGLGLYLCDAFMKLFDGMLEIESEFDKGTTVTLKFPPERTISQS